MASWTDGPEYAPRERPEAFVEPVVAPLDVPPTPVDLSAGAPGELPAFDSPEADVPDLATLIPSAAVPGRNPRLAFEVVSTVLAPPSPVSTSPAWASAHSGPGSSTQPAWSPQQPLSSRSTPITASLAQHPAVQPGAQVNPPSFPAPGTPQWFAPPDPGQRYQAPPQVSIGAVWRALTPGVAITLLIGAFINLLAVVLLALGFALSTRIAYRRRQVRGCFAAAAGLVGLSWLWTFVANGLDPDSAWSAASGVAQLACGGLVLALGLVVALALTRGERPDPRP